MIERHCRLDYRRIQATLSAKSAPFLTSYPLALVFRALQDDSAERLLAVMATFAAKCVVLPPPIAADEHAPFDTRLF